MTPRLVACLAALAAAPPALADQPRATAPQRDVDVTYQVPVAHTADTAMLQRLRYSQALQRQRLDMPTAGKWMLLDFARHQVSIVIDAQKASVIRDFAGDAGVITLQPGQSWQKAGQQVIAGISCTDWQIIGPTGLDKIFCLTDDGVTLRAEHHARVVMLALSVHYAPQAPSLFTIPADYTIRRPM